MTRSRRARSSAASGAARAGKRRRPAGPRILGLLLVSVVVAALMFLFVLPGRTYLAQRQSLASAQTRVKVLSDENASLRQQAAKLQTDAEIERLARQQYGLVKPGEQAFAILPSTKAPAGPAAPTPAHHRGWLSRLWHDVQFWN